MTNMEYILSRLTERDLAELYMDHSWLHYNGNLNKKVRKAFNAWRRDTDKPNRNFTVEGEPDPCIWEWSKIHNHRTGKWENGRPSIVSFQQWLCFQYNEKYWNETN